VTDQQKQALQYLAAVASDYAATLPPSVRGPFVREAQAAIRMLESEPSASEPGEPATVHG
jgi:hypothetical protein